MRDPWCLPGRDADSPVRRRATRRDRFGFPAPPREVPTVARMDDSARISGRERILTAAYDLFSRHGHPRRRRRRGDRRAGVAKMTLYRNFASKEELVLAFLERREEHWTRAWLQAEVERRARDAGRQRLLAIFDVFDEWFAPRRLRGLLVHQRPARARRPRRPGAPGGGAAPRQHPRLPRRAGRRGRRDRPRRASPASGTSS